MDKPKIINLSCQCGGFDHQARLILDEEWGATLEVITPFNSGIWYRFKKAMRYLFLGGSLYSFDMVLDEKQLKKLKDDILN